MTDPKMSPQGLLVRSLEPDHVPEVVRLHCEVFAQSPSGRLGPHYVQGVVRWFLDDDEAVALVAEDATGQVVGYAFGAPAAYGPRLRSALWWTLAGALARRPWALLDSEVAATMTDYARRRFRTTRRRATTVPAAAPRDTSGDWSLVAIAVSPAHRKSSIGRRLLADFESRSRDRGASELRLTVTLENESARRFYDRAGWAPGRPSPDKTMAYSKRLTGAG